MGFLLSVAHTSHDDCAETGLLSRATSARLARLRSIPQARRCSTLDADLEVQRTTMRPELTAFFYLLKKKLLSQTDVRVCGSQVRAYVQAGGWDDDTRTGVKSHKHRVEIAQTCRQGHRIARIIFAFRLSIGTRENEVNMLEKNTWSSADTTF